MTPVLSISMWVSLSAEQRKRIRDLFSIPRSSHVEVVDGRMMTDGTTFKDFETLTIEKMQQYLKSDVVDFHRLFDLVVARIQDEIEGKPLIEEIVSTTPITIIIPPNKKQRNGKKNK